jgi:predicted AlkP superfamily phosphohydrolase/phosphomutase
MVKLAVIGLDSVSWNVLDKIMDKNELPNLKRIKDNGVHVDLKSTYPFITCPAWKCYSTGKNPGKLGVYYWFDFNKKDKSLKINHSYSFDGNEVWDYLSVENLRSGIINMPLSFPPKKIKGYMISGMHAFQWNNYTYPNSLKNYIEKKCKYKVTTSTPYDDLKNIIPEFKKLINSRFDACFQLNKDYKIDFLHITIFCVDSLHHFHWDLINKENSPIFEVWNCVDENIGKLLHNLNPDYLFIISDHGMTRLKSCFRANMWLEREGYLKFKSSIFNKFRITGKYKKIEFKRNWIIKINSKLPNILKKLIPTNTYVLKAFGLQFKDEEGEVGITALFDRIDWEKTKAIVIGDGLLYIFENNISKNEELELIRKFSEIKNPINGELIMEIKDKFSIYSGEYIVNAPDYCIVPKNGYFITDRISPNGIIDSNLRWKAFHQIEGIFLASGPGIKKDQKIENAKIYDLAPTILHMFGLPIPNDMDGRVLTEIFEESSELAKRKPNYVDPSYYDKQDKKQEVKAKIRKLKKETKL